MSKRLKRILILAGLALAVALALIIVPLSCVRILFWWYDITHEPLLELQLEKAPRLNEPVKLTCIRRLDIESTLRSMANRGTTTGTEHEKIDIRVEHQDLKTAALDREIPLSSILVEGNFDWEATVTVDKSLNRIKVSPSEALAVDYLDIKSAERDGVPLVFSAIIKFPKEGNWGINAQSVYHRNPDGGPGDHVLLNVTQDGSSFGWPDDYRPYTVCRLEHPPNPAATTIDWNISKPPKLNEPVRLTWNIIAMRDIELASAEIEFRVMRGTDSVKISAEEMLINGDLQWSGSLKDGIPVELWAEIKFLEVGDWEIYPSAQVKYEYWTNTFPLYMHIGRFKSSWGWAESHETKHKGSLTPPPVTPIPVPAPSQ